MATTQPPKSTRRKRRWGDGPADGSADGISGGGNGGDQSSKRKSRFSSSPPGGATNNNGNDNNGSGVAPVAAATPAAPPAADPKARAAALQASIQARLAALKARTGGGAAAAPKSKSTVKPPSTAAAAAPSTKTIQKSNQNKRPLASAKNESNENNETSSKKKAKVFELDMSSTAPTRLLEKQQREEQLRISAEPKKKMNPYLAHTVSEPATSSTLATTAASTSITADNDGNIQKDAAATSIQKLGPGEEILLDTRLAATSKRRLKSRPINFVAPGTYIALGEKKRQQAQRAGESGFLSGRKVGNVVKSVGMGGGVSSVEVEGGEGGTSIMATKDIYGASQAGKLTEQTLPPRIDAPELQLEDYITVTAKKKILTSLGDVDAEKNDAAISAAVDAAASSMPYAMEWWDAELLPGKLRKELAGEEGRAIASRAKKRGGKVVGGNDKAAETKGSEDLSTRFRTDNEKHTRLIEKCYKNASIAQSRTHPLIQHPVPILTPAQKAAKEEAKNKPSTLHLTKAERKRHRKLRRAERFREQQDLQAAGVIPAPEPRLTLSNYMKVLGDQAILDPSKMEATVMEQIQSRKIKHEQMNEERKLTKEQKAAKHTRKLAEDTTQSVKVALFYVKDMSHPYHRAKVDLNAQQNGITGGVLECENGVNLVVAEGGERAIKRYTRLMTVRMRWKGEDFYEEDEESEEELMVGENDDDNEEGINNAEGEEGKKREKRKKFNPDNECHLIWTGMALKRAFHSFMFQNAQNSIVARKILEAKGVAHYWDLAAGFAERQGGSGVNGGGDGELKFRLG